MHASAKLCAGVGRYSPTLHLMHPECPVLGAYCPGVHEVSGASQHMSFKYAEVQSGVAGGSPTGPQASQGGAKGARKGVKLYADPRPTQILDVVFLCTGVLFQHISTILKKK